MEENLTCIICRDLFDCPTTLSCGHSFCKDCISSSLRIKPVCAICRTIILMDPKMLKENLILKEIVLNSELYKKQQEEKKQDNQINKKNIHAQQQQQILDQQINKGEPERFYNVIVLFLENENIILFPNTIVEVKFSMNIDYSTFQQTCSDKIVLLKNQNNNEYAVRAEIKKIEPYYQNSSNYKGRFLILNRVVIEKIQEFDQSFEEQKQPEQQQQQIQQQFQQQQQLNADMNNNQKKIIIIANLINFQDNQNPISSEGLINIQQTIKQIMEFIRGWLQIYQQDNDQTTYLFHDYIQSGGLVQSLQRLGAQISDLNEISKFTFLVSDILLFSTEIKKRIYDTQDIIERIIIINKEIQPFTQIQHISGIFNLGYQRNGSNPFQMKQFILVLIAFIIGIIIYQYAPQIEKYWRYRR